MRITRRGDALAQLLAQEGINNQAVLQAIASTPRELFLPDALKHKAYQNTALPIGQGQTISQPYIVARMTELLLNVEKKPEKVLEIGTGSGYQTAILAQIFNQVFRRRTHQIVAISGKKADESTRLTQYCNETWRWLARLGE